MFVHLVSEYLICRFSLVLDHWKEALFQTADHQCISVVGLTTKDGGQVRGKGEGSEESDSKGM